MNTATIRTSIEFVEGYQAYTDGIDGYTYQAYPDGTQEATDWFAGWLDAKAFNQWQNSKAQ